MFTMIKLKRPALLQRLFALPRRLAVRIIRRNPDRYLKQQGWTPALLGKVTQWQGYYRTRYGGFKGRVVASASPPSFYVYKPPEKLKRHSHWSCFSNQGNGWHSVHFKRVPKDLDSGVMAIERIINESMKLN
jgi:hypothetical protein